MWFLVIDDVIEQGPVQLPKLWTAFNEGVEADVQYPLAEFEQKGYTADLNTLGWLEQNILPATLTKYQMVTGHTHVVNGDRVDSSPIIISKPLATKKAIRIAEIEAEGNGLIDAQMGDNSRKRTLLALEGVAILDAQVGQGGPPNPRNPRQDTLTNIFTYVAEVSANMDAAFVEIDDLATTDPSTVVLVHPTLPS